MRETTSKSYRMDLKGGIVHRSALGFDSCVQCTAREGEVYDKCEGMMQELLKQAAIDGITEWSNLLSPRNPLKRIQTYGELWTCLV